MTGRTVQLFATCLGDLLFPDVVRDAVRLLEEGGCRVEFPAAQLCCGQPAFNAGHRRAARRVARAFARSFSRAAPIVTPSGSCAAFVKHRLPDLVGCEPFEIFELSEFLASEGVAIARYNEGRTFAFHPSCHLTRELGVPADTSEELLRRSGATVVPVARPDLCCGFGGVFAARQPELSLAMADQKLTLPAPADALVTADPGCLAHLDTRAEAHGVKVVHLASALVGRI
jgi:L-lactate dehydrogenase complex protein LldE